ncbi:MAG: glycosyl hydrolase 53 family protein [Prevotellaceae bacterium]|nr:glycosyl hydrolase 53 family protein [Prevotellaceae bacterium]
MEKLKTKIITLLLCLVSLASCGDEDKSEPQTEPEEETIEFAKGADVSWLTEMESCGVKFYDAAGTEKECMLLLREMGVNSIRLRVWVNPSDGWNGKQDVLVKALRAHSLGMRIMIDFHYSDTWADPASQTVPSEWADYTLAELKQAVAEHTTDVLQTLKDKGIDVEWVQVGNETSSGMLWETGRANGNDFANFVQLLNSGYDAAKSVYPDSKVIVHINNGYDLSLFTWMFDGLRSNNARYDIIGMSLYPEESTWQTQTSACLSNIKTLVSRYGKDVMVCEIGMPWDSDNAEAVMTTMVNGCKAISGCLGVFYWEPECYGSWKGYTKGAFDNTGKPTSALKAFNN